MNHPALANIDGDVGYPRPLVGVLEKHKVTGLCFCFADRRADVVQALRGQASNAPADAAVVDDPAHEAGAVKGRGGIRAAPHIREAYVFFRFLHHRGELLVLERFGRYLVIRLRVDVYKRQAQRRNAPRARI